MSTPQGAREGGAGGAGKVTASPPFRSQREALGVPESQMPSRQRMVEPAGGASSRASAEGRGDGARTAGACAGGAGVGRAPGRMIFTPPRVAQAAGAAGAGAMGASMAITDSTGI